MSEEESLLADADTSTPSTESTETTTEAPTPWYVSEGVEGAGDKPEFLQDKYKSLSDQAAAYPELASKFGGFTGAPEDYELSFPDGVEGEWVDDDPMMANFKGWAKENNLNQEGFTNLLHMYVQNEFDNQGQDRASELAAIGDNAQSRLQNINDFAKANLSEEDYRGVLAATTTAQGVKAIEALIAQTRGYKIPDTSEHVDAGLSHSDLREKLADPRYASDPDYRKEVDTLYERKFGKEPRNTVVG